METAVSAAANVPHAYLTSLTLAPAASLTHHSPEPTASATLDTLSTLQATANCAMLHAPDAATFTTTLVCSAETLTPTSTEGSVCATPAFT